MTTPERLWIYEAEANGEPFWACDDYASSILEQVAYVPEHRLKDLVWLARLGLYVRDKSLPGQPPHSLANPDGSDTEQTARARAYLEQHYGQS